MATESPRQPLCLRSYQQDIINKVRSLMQQGVKSILIQSATGSGKTLLTAHMIGTAASKGMASFFTVHRRELLMQSSKAFTLQGIPHGVIAPYFMEDKKQLVQIASIQTLARRHHRYVKPRLIVWDEVHHMGAASWSKLHAQYPSAFHIGLTATPERMDGKGLGQWFSHMVQGPSVTSLIEQGYLCPYKIYAPTTINTEGIHRKMGDFDKEELNKAVDKPTITGDAILHYKKLADGKRAIVFCVSIEHSKNVAQQFQEAGINSAHIDGGTEAYERDRAVEKFRNGDVRVLCNVDLCGEGFDIPNMEVAILLRPTQSLVLYLQQLGRVLRPCGGKSLAIISDHSGNCFRFGLPDEEREWSLLGRDKRDSGNDEATNKIKTCPKCFACQIVGATSCKFCGFVFEIQPREVKQVEGELSEIDVEAIRRSKRREVGMAKSYEDLVELAKQRKYANPHGYAWYVMQARRRKIMMRQTA